MAEINLQNKSSRTGDSGPEVYTPRRSVKAPVDRTHRQKEKILKAAGRLFWQKGYVGTSIEDVAKSANLNKATIYYYFKSKSQILYEIVTRAMDELLELATPIFNSNLSDEKKLELLVTTHVKWETSHPGLAGIGQVERKNLPPRLMRAFTNMRDEYESMFRQVVGQILKKNNNQDIEAKLATTFSLGMLNAIIQWYKSSGPLTDDEIADKALIFISRALTAKDKL